MAKVEVKCEKCGAINYVDITNHDKVTVPAFHDNTDNVVGRLLTSGCKNKKMTDIPEVNIPDVTEERKSCISNDYEYKASSSKGVNVMNKIEALKAAGFTDEQINQMVSVTGVSLDGPAIAKDEIEEQIFKNGYIRNCKLHRRWITAQFIHAYFGYEGGVRGYINMLPYMYQFKMMLEEVRVISKLEQSDDECFKERASFFTMETVFSTCLQYISDLSNYIDDKNKKDHRKCKGIPYVRLHGLNPFEFKKGDVFMADVDRRVLSPLRHQLYDVTNSPTYTILYARLLKFVHSGTFIDLPYKTRKNKLWIDAYLGAGAFYSLKNLCAYDDLKLRDYEGDGGTFMDAAGNLKYLSGLVGNKKGFQLYGLFKQAMEDNEFTYDTFKKICEQTKKEMQEEKEPTKNSAKKSK